MGLLTAGVLAAGYTITQVQADEQSQDLYTSSIETEQVESSKPTKESTSQTEAIASAEDTTTSTVSTDSTVDTEESVASVTPETTQEGETSEADTAAIAGEETQEQADTETVATEAEVSEESAESAVTESEIANQETPPVTTEETASVPDQTENRQIIIDRVGLASDALDGYSDEQIAQSRVEAENLGSDPGYSYSWLLQQTPANSLTGSM